MPEPGRLQPPLSFAIFLIREGGACGHIDHYVISGICRFAG